MAGQASSGSGAYPNITRGGAWNSIESHMAADYKVQKDVAGIIDGLKERKSAYEAEIAERNSVINPTKIDKRYLMYLQSKVVWMNLTINNLTHGSMSIMSQLDEAQRIQPEFAQVGTRPDGYVTDPGEEYATQNPEAAASPNYDYGEYIHRNDGDSDVSSSYSQFGSPYYSVHRNDCNL